MPVLMYDQDDWRSRGRIPVSAAVPEMDEVPFKGGSSKEPARVRIEFPETWLWTESDTGYHPALHSVPCLVAWRCSLLRLTLILYYKYINKHVELQQCT